MEEFSLVRGQLDTRELLEGEEWGGTRRVRGEWQGRGAQRGEGRGEGA